MQDDTRGYLVDLENLEIRIGGDYPDFLSAKTALVGYAKTRLVETQKSLMEAQQNYAAARSSFRHLTPVQIMNAAEYLPSQSRVIEADYDLSVAEENHIRAHQDFIRAQQHKNPYEFQPYGDLGFAPHGPLTTLNLNGEG